MARPKKETAKKTPAKTAAPKAGKRAAGIKMIQSTGRQAGAPSAKRPPNNPDVPQATIDHLNTMLNDIKTILDNFSQHLRALDRRRLNGVGIKKMGFIERAYELALENSEFLPHYITLEKFGQDIEYFMDFRSLTDLTAQLREQLWNITIQSSDIAYTDALEFYASVREAAKRRVDSAETLYAALAPFFKSHGRKTEGEEAQPTRKQALRDFKALESGKHDGILVIENRSPKMTGGKRKIIDETFKDTAEFKTSEQGEVSN